MFKNGVITDFKGQSHPFVVCALSTSSFNSEESTVAITSYDIDSAYIDEIVAPRAVFIGIAVCNPVDEWDEEKGKMIALNKAKGFKATNIAKSAALFATRAGMISEGLVEALLNREVEHIQEDPEYVIKGYNRMKARYEQEKAMKAYVDETPDDLKEIASKLATMSSKDIERVINVAIIKSDE